MTSTKGETVVEFSTLKADVQELLEKARHVRQNAYTPYSKFDVGACLQLTDGAHVLGCNVENASFTVGTCAERCALSSARAQGLLARWTSAAVVADMPEVGDIVSPCGACRQMLREFAESPEAIVYMTSSKLDRVRVATITELLPYAFVKFD